MKESALIPSIFGATRDDYKSNFVANSIYVQKRRTTCPASWPKSRICLFYFKNRTYPRRNRWKWMVPDSILRLLYRCTKPSSSCCTGWNVAYGEHRSNHTPNTVRVLHVSPIVRLSIHHWLKSLGLFIDSPPCNLIWLQLIICFRPKFSRTTG